MVVAIHISMKFTFCLAPVEWVYLLKCGNTSYLQIYSRKFYLNYQFSTKLLKLGKYSTVNNHDTKLIKSFLDHLN